MKQKKVSVILCSYNEATNLPTVVAAVHENMDKLPYDYEIIIVNDGSSDNSMEVIEQLCKDDDKLYYIEFSRNFGHQNALKAGLDYATGDCLISMDADMQHPPRMLPRFLEKWEEGYDIVYTRRMEDQNLPKMKRKTSAWYYRIINMLSDIELEEGTADFRLMDRKAANVIIGIKGSSLFIRGLVKWIGFKQYGIDYMPDERLSGSTKYTVKKMMSMAVQGILSFSTKPLHIALYSGFIIAALSLLSMPYAFISYFTDHYSNGWASLICVVGFLGGFQLFVLGIIGLYIGRIFNQTKNYPAYIVRSTNIPQK
ncbi:glycosyltransferase family 2 protein [Dysgonomonas sp. 520]|uniref:glycosyltransferase family 2 protein n=1 Tax=Dysgonomonas sp. 520 TaxID=2302931 RepID=UPI0013D844B7|nr:glycosyltransferase family 2 protein [Dysgonomonas sp. 520]NDW08085.1 glycosyltransferase [Dysgonomonas sp. 520]